MAKANAIYQLKITLADVRPPVWRRVQVNDCMLATLHEIIQTCMGWGDAHMWAFEVDGVEYGDDTVDDLDMESARKAKLSKVVEEGIKKFKYVYDFGDDWRHLIQVEKVLEAEPKVKYPRCIDGSRACPPEDCGGPWGYGSLLEAVQNPEHKDHEEMLEWLGDAFDPEAFDLEAVNKALARV